MPPRLDLLTKRWPASDLPILPFLAPRVFAPWPCSLRSLYLGSTATANTNSTRFFCEDSDKLPQTACDVALTSSSRRGKFDPKIEQEHDLPQSQNLQGGVEHTPNNIAASRGGSEELSKSPGEQDEFWTKYEEIWGGLTKKRPPESIVAPVRRGMGMVKGTQEQRSDSRIPRRIPLAVKWDNIDQQEAYLRRHKSDATHEQMKLWIGRKRSIDRSNALKQFAGLPRLRTKYVRLTREGYSGDLNYSSWWNSRFAIINTRYDKTMKGRMELKLPMYECSWASEPFTREVIEDKPTAFLRAKWMAIPPNRRKEMWPGIMVMILADHPRQALKFLEATFITPYPPGYAISDSLDFIISHFNEDRNVYGSEFLVALSKAVFLFLNEGGDHVHLSQRTVFCLLDMICLDAEELRSQSGMSVKVQRKGWIAKSLYRTLVRVGHPLHENTLIQFASGLAKNGEIKTACRILQRLRDEGFAFNSPKVLRLCSTLLQEAHQIMRAKNGAPRITATEMFQFILETGAECNATTYNILIKSSLDAGNHETGWKLFEVMIENGFTPDVYTYSILLNDAKIRMDAFAIRNVMDLVRQSDIRNDWIITDVLHTILLLHQQERESSERDGSPLRQEKAAFDRLLEVYCDYFQVGPLARLIPNFAEHYPALNGTAHSSQEHLHEPPGPTLVVMVSGYLDDANTPHLATQFYKNFRDLIYQNDPVVSPLTTTTHIWNLVLMRIGKFFERLADCANLVGDMLSGLDRTSTLPRTPETDEDTQKPDHTINSVSKLPLRPKPVALEPFEAEDILKTEPRAGTVNPKPLMITAPKPDVYTWSILLKIFMDHHQPRAAERILKMMSKRQITPNQITWNKLVLGYARMQDTAMTVDVLRRLEAAGLPADEYTLTALGLIRNRRALNDAMKRTESRLAGLDSDFLDNLRRDLDGVSNEEECKIDVDGELEKVWAVGKNEEEEEE